MTTENAIRSETVDTVGLTCPGPVLTASQRIRGLAEGAILEIVSDCEGAADDLQAWANATGHQLLQTEVIDAHTRSYRIHKGYAARLDLDLRGKRCPVPVIEAARAIAHLAPGETLRLISDCPRAPEEVSSWVRATGLELVNSVTDQNGDGNFYVRRTAATH